MLYLNKKLYIFGKIDSPLCWIQMMRLLYTSFLVNVYVSFSYGFNLGYIIRNGKNTENNNDIKTILETQRITLLGGGVLNEKITFTVKKNLLSYLFSFFYLVIFYLLCFNFCSRTNNWLSTGLIVPVLDTIIKL